MVSVCGQSWPSTSPYAVNTNIHLIKELRFSCRQFFGPPYYFYNSTKFLRRGIIITNTVKPLYNVFQGTERFKRYKEVNVIRR